MPEGEKTDDLTIGETETRNRSNQGRGCALARAVHFSTRGGQVRYGESAPVRFGRSVTQPSRSLARHKHRLQNCLTPTAARISHIRPDVTDGGGLLPDWVPYGIMMPQDACTEHPHLPPLHSLAANHRHRGHSKTSPPFVCCLHYPWHAAHPSEYGLSFSQVTSSAPPTDLMLDRESDSHVAYGFPFCSTVSSQRSNNADGCFD